MASIVAGIVTDESNSIAIAGAGIGGLTAALALAQRGLSSTIYERRDALSEAGAGIQLGPNATNVLARLGVLESVRALSSEPDALSVHDAMSGKVLARLPLGAWMRERHGAPYLTLHRQDLHRALATAAEVIARIQVLPGRNVVAFAQSSSADRVDIAFRDGKTVAADALIVADGLWSRLREAVTPCAGPSPAGKCAYRTVVPRYVLADGLAANDVHIWLAPGAHVVHYPVRQGTQISLVAVIDGASTVDAWDSPATQAALSASPVAQFVESIREMIFYSRAWRMWPLQTLPRLDRWTRGAVALLGDAAHPLLPFFAQGGGLAIEDAAVLADCLARGGPMPDRLQAYEKERRARAERVVAASHTNGRIYHLDGAMAAARNAVLGTVPAHLMMRRYDWLYGWKT
ncbi:MAG: FAD-dependent monooxygenase [Hyphomicrobium sp.]